jgi:hypothetical protein
MKRVFIVAAGLALSLSFAPIAGTAAASRVPAFQGAYEKNQEATKTFSGTVVKQGDIYVLSDAASKTNYQLDGASKVKDFVGKSVKVTGTLDAENLTIHVQSIQEIA